MKNTGLSFLGTTGKIFLLILGLSLVPVLVSGIFLYYLDFRETKIRHDELARQNAYFQAQNLNDLISKIRTDLHLLADMAETRIHDREFINQLISGYVTPQVIVSGVAVVSLEGEVVARTGQTPKAESMDMSQREGARRRESFAFLSELNGQQWNMIIVQKMMSDSETMFLIAFLPVEGIMPVKSLPGAFLARWSALMDHQGNVLSLGGSWSIDEKLFQDYATLSFERDRLVEAEISDNGHSFQVFMIPVAQNLMILGQAFDFYDFTTGRQPLGTAILVSAAGWILIMTLVSYLIAQRGADYLARREVCLQAMNEQVVEAGKMASIGELASGIAHEINNPVAIMVEEAGWMQDLLEDDTQLAGTKNFEELNRSLRQIRQQGRRCKDITYKLLSFARKSDSRIQEVDLNALAQEIAAISEKRAKYAGVKIYMDLDPSIPSIQTSSTEMQQVFLNIVNNAIDAMEKKGGELTVSSKQDLEGIHFRFSDTGEGIPKANLGKIFDPFFTTKPVGKGTGLGLSICFAIIQNLGGKIIVTSQPGEGTTFHIQLPSPKEKTGDTLILTE
jgi:signal transduction histidine kinase